jgi:hypothetical protein
MQCGQVSKRKPSRRSSSNNSSDKEDTMKTAVVPKLVTESNDVASTIVLCQGKKLDTNDAAHATIKAQMFHAFRLQGHDPIQRNCRVGYIDVWCKTCNAKCAASSNQPKQRDGWYVTKINDAVNRQCSLAAGKF